MSQLLQRRANVRVGAILLLVLLLLLGGAYRFRSKVRVVYNIGRALLAGDPSGGDGQFRDVIFIHHSTGRNLIAEGGVRQLFTEAGYNFWDHDYNHIGLTRPDGAPAGYGYNVPDDNTDPDGYAQLFVQPLRLAPLNAFSAFMQHDVIIFKSCFLANHIADQEQLEAYKRYYLFIREVIDQYLDHIFVILTPPPLTPAATNSAEALRARVFAGWLVSEEYLGGHANLFAFDLFDLLASDPTSAEANTLRPEYRPESPDDSHPNTLANETAGPLIVDFVTGAIASYRAAGQ